MGDWIKVEGPQRAVYLFDTRLVGVNADNGKKLLFTVALVGLVLALGWALRAAARVALRGARNERAAFWTRQGIKLFAGVVMVFGVAAVWFDDPTTLATALGLITAGLAFALEGVLKPGQPGLW